jgi:hypothetical protein
LRPRYAPETRPLPEQSATSTVSIKIRIPQFRLRRPGLPPLLFKAKWLLLGLAVAGLVAAAYYAGYKQGSAGRLTNPQVTVQPRPTGGV